MWFPSYNCLPSLISLSQSKQRLVGRFESFPMVVWTRDPWRPAELLAGISRDRNCRRKTACKASGGFACGPWHQRCWHFFFSESCMWEDWEQPYFAAFLCCFESRPYPALNKFDSLLPALSQRLQARCVMFWYLVFQGFSAPHFSIHFSPILLCLPSRLFPSLRGLQIKACC